MFFKIQIVPVFGLYNTLNEYQYGTRPDNVFRYEDPLKMKQKEMNLEAIGYPQIDIPR